MPSRSPVSLSRFNGIAFVICMLVSAHQYRYVIQQRWDLADLMDDASRNMLGVNEEIDCKLKDSSKEIVTTMATSSNTSSSARDIVETTTTAATSIRGASSHVDAHSIPPKTNQKTTTTVETNLTATNKKVDAESLTPARAVVVAQAIATTGAVEASHEETVHPPPAHKSIPPKSNQTETANFVETNLTEEDITFNNNNSSAPPSNTSCKPLRPAKWEWIHNQRKDNETTNNSPIPQQRLLIAMYSGYGSYERLLQLTSQLNRAYAKHWGHDVVTLLGAGLLLDSERGGVCEPPKYRATFNKIPLLKAAIESKENYDQVLILDSDAMIYDLDYDVTKILLDANNNTSIPLVAGRRCRVKKRDHTWDINAGVTIWNLHHPRIQELYEAWDGLSRKNIAIGKHENDDQYQLHKVFRAGNNTYGSSVHGIIDEFNYKGGTVVRHYIRGRVKGWDGANLAVDDRENKIRVDVAKACKRHPGICF